MRENLANKKYKRAKVKNVMNAGIKGNGSRAHVREMVENRMHLGWFARRMPTVSSVLVAAPEVQARDR